MNYADFCSNIEIMSYNLTEQDINPEDVDVVYTKSSGEHIIALVKDDEIIDYMKW